MFIQMFYLLISVLSSSPNIQLQLGCSNYWVTNVHANTLDDKAITVIPEMGRSVRSVNIISVLRRV